MSWAWRFVGERGILGLMVVSLVGAVGFSGCASQGVGSLFRQDPYQKMIERQRAKEAYEDAQLKKLPALKQGDYEALGDLDMREGRFDSAFLQYEKALQKDPGEPRLLYKRGLVYLYRNLPVEAAAQFQKVLKKQPDNALAREGLGCAFFKLRRYADAEEQLKQALQQNSRLWLAHNYLGIIYDYQKKSAAAVKEYQAAIALKPNQGMLYNNLGVAYSLLGDYQQAASSFERAVATGRGGKESYDNLALVLCKLGKYQQALRAFEMSGDEAQAYNNLGYVYLVQKKYPQAVEALQKAIALRPSFYAKANENLRVAQAALEKQTGSSETPIAAGAAHSKHSLPHIPNFIYEKDLSQ